MRKLLVIVLTNIFLFSIINAQCYDIQMNDIQTPAGSPVETWLTCESSLQTRQGFDCFFAINYPNARQIQTYDYPVKSDM